MLRLHIFFSFAKLDPEALEFVGQYGQGRKRVCSTGFPKYHLRHNWILLIATTQSAEG
jgi:hypothetical protein